MAKTMVKDKQHLRQALLKRATGYEYDEKEIVLDRNGQTQGKVKLIKRHMPPDMTAIKTVMRMMRTGEW